jgi:hypothetical protein
MERKYTQTELKETADKLLADAQYRWDGREICRTDYLQTRFEYRMKTGAYSRSGESRRR